jgi:Pirin C-terminal cupin domain
LLLGGTPFTDEVIMWWNFIGRSHEEIVEYRQRSDNRDAQFGEVTGYRGAISHLPRRRCRTQYSDRDQRQGPATELTPTAIEC